MNEVEPKRDPKHIALDRAIDELNHTYNITQELLLKIKGMEDTPEKMGAGTIKQDPSLAEILVEGPDRIIKQCGIINQALDEIKEILF